MKAPILLALAVLSVTQAAEPTHTLKLACYGTASTGQWIDMNITIDLAARTVAAFGHTVSMSENERKISFGGGQPAGKDGGGWSVRGDIDRVNSQLTATTTGDEEGWDRIRPRPVGTLSSNESHGADVLLAAVPISAVRSGWPLRVPAAISAAWRGIETRCFRALVNCRGCHEKDAVTGTDACALRHGACG